MTYRCDECGSTREAGIRYISDTSGSWCEFCYLRADKLADAWRQFGYAQAEVDAMLEVARGGRQT